MLCDLLSDYSVPCIRKGTCLLLLNNGMVPAVQTNTTCMLIFLPIQQKQN